MCIFLSNMVAHSRVRAAKTKWQNTGKPNSLVYGWPKLSDSVFYYSQSSRRVNIDANINLYDVNSDMLSAKDAGSLKYRRRSKE